MASYVQDYTFTIAPGDSQVLNCDAHGITCIESNLTEFQIEINDGQRATFRRQFEFAAERGDTIKKFRIINMEAVSLVVRFLVWRGLFRDRRSLSNDVQGINPQSFDEIAAAGFVAVGKTTGVGATDFGVIQFRNPAASGKLVAITGGDWSADTAVVLRAFSLNAAAGSVVRNSLSVLAGATNGVLDIIEDATEATRLYDTVNETDVFLRRRVGANDNKVFSFDRPIFLRAGEGIAVQPNIVNVNVDVAIQLLEIDG